MSLEPAAQRLVLRLETCRVPLAVMDLVELAARVRDRDPRPLPVHLLEEVLVELEALDAPRVLHDEAIGARHEPCEIAESRNRGAAERRFHTCIATSSSIVAMPSKYEFQYAPDSPGMYPTSITFVEASS